MPAGAVLLFSDATILRWFPPLRYAWAFRGQQTQVQITGQNAKRVLFGTINPRTGHRVVLRRLRQRQEDFQAFLRELRRRYRGRPLRRNRRWFRKNRSKSKYPWPIWRRRKK